MSNFAQAVYVETLKARRSRVSLFTALGIVLLPLAGGFFMLVLKDPEMALRVGLINAKARLVVGVADWPSYLGFLTQAVAGGGIVLFGLIVSWVFGREYSDRTVKDLLALPTSRSSVVLAKFGVVAAWSAGLTVLTCLVGLGIGAAIQLPGATTPALLQGMSNILVAGSMAIALVTPIAFFASAGRGYLAPIGFVFLLSLLTQVLSAAGWGEFFPWAIPGLFSQGADLGLISYAIVVLTGLVGIAATLVWWERVDQAR